MKTLRSLALTAIAAGFCLRLLIMRMRKFQSASEKRLVAPTVITRLLLTIGAPDGYYGPEWFGGGGIFIGAGPWYHGSDHFYGHVDHQLDYRKGYRGGFPARGAAPTEHRAEFHGRAMHDVHGHEAPHGRK